VTGVGTGESETDWIGVDREVGLVNSRDKVTRTRRIALHLETHCNIGSKRAFPTGVLDS